jgi:hypothetical protein
MRLAFQRTSFSMNLWIGPLLWSIRWHLTGIYKFHFSFEVLDD